MRPGLDRGTLRRLVQLYLLTTLLAFAAGAYEAVEPGWSAFSADYDRLVASHFGTPADWLSISGGAVLLAALVFHLVCAVYLLRLRRWARTGFWGSIVLVYAVIALPGLNMPYFYGPASSIATVAGAALFGAILLLVYCVDRGQAWFDAGAATAHEEV